MANNYLLFSEVLAHLTDEEQKWLEQQLEYIWFIRRKRAPA
jgi:hypothetical protein